MLEEMRETRVARALVFSADVIPDLEIDHRDLVIFEQDHLKTVGERVSREIEFRRTSGGRLILRGKRERERRGYADREKYRGSRSNPFPRVRPHRESLRSA